MSRADPKERSNSPAIISSAMAMATMPSPAATFIVDASELAVRKPSAHTRRERG
jgi:hypothetical protein